MEKAYIPDSELPKCSSCVWIWDDCFSNPSTWCRLGRDPQECEGPK